MAHGLGVILGLIVTKVRRLKGFIVTGCCLFATAFGILIRFRSRTSVQVGGVIAADIILGIGGGMFSYPRLVSVQSRIKHARVSTLLEWRAAPDTSQMLPSSSDCTTLLTGLALLLARFSQDQCGGTRP